MKSVWLLLQVFAVGWKNRKNIAFVIVLIIAVIGTICYFRTQENIPA